MSKIEWLIGIAVGITLALLDTNLREAIYMLWGVHAVWLAFIHTEECKPEVIYIFYPSSVSVSELTSR